MRKAALAVAVVVAAGVAAALVAVLVFSYAFRRGESFAEGSSYRAAPDGLRALALLAESQGYAVVRLFDPWELARYRGVLVSAAAHREQGGLSSG